MCCHDHHRDWRHHEGHHRHHPDDWGPRDRGCHGPYEHRDPHHHHCGPDCWDRGLGPGGREAGPFGFRRRFVSNRELLETLKGYLKELENEAQGVREAIAELEEEMEEKMEEPGGGR